MKEQYKPISLVQARNKLIEECGELIAALGKTGRWGELSTNPELPLSEQEINIDLVRREFKDVKEAYELYMEFWEKNHA